MNQEANRERVASDRQPPIFLVTGAILGLMLGLVVSLLILPVRYKGTAPAALSAEHKAAQRLLIARAYQANPDAIRAISRLGLLNDAAVAESLAAQAQQALSAGDEQAARELADLAAAVSGISLAEVEAPQPTAASGETPAAAVTATSAPTAGPFLLVDRQEVCQAAFSGLLQIELRDRDGYPAPGVQINVTWEGGLDTFFTGLKPSVGAGYADFKMTPGVSYTVQVGEGGQPLNAVTAPECTDANGSTFSGGLYLVFGQ